MCFVVKLVILIHHSSKSDCCLEHTAASMPSYSLGTWYFGDIVRTIIPDLVIDVDISILMFWETDPISPLSGPFSVYTCGGDPKLNETDENNYRSLSETFEADICPYTQNLFKVRDSCDHVSEGRDVLIWIYQSWKLLVRTRSKNSKVLNLLKKWTAFIISKKSF